MIDLSPETLRPLLFFVLLIGPTVAWLAYRLAHVQSQRATRSLRDTATDGEWFCPTCRSLNHAWADRCYRGCAPRAPAAVPLAPAAAPAAAPGQLVAVGPGLQPSPAAGEPLVAPLAIPVAVGVAVPGPDAAPASRREPAARVTAAPHVTAAAPAPTPTPTTTLRSGPVPARAAMPGRQARGKPGRSADPVPVMDVTPPRRTAKAAARRPTPTPAPPQEPPEATAKGEPAVAPSPARVGVCPYLGLRRDARSYFAFVSPRHRCFATASPSKIDTSLQEAHCFGDIRGCPQYPAPRRRASS